MLITVYVGTISCRHEMQVDNSSTLRSVMDTATEQYGVDFTRGTTNLSGQTLSEEDYDKTFEEMDINDTCFLVNSPKSDCG